MKIPSVSFVVVIASEFDVAVVAFAFLAWNALIHRITGMVDPVVAVDVTVLCNSPGARFVCFAVDRPPMCLVVLVQLALSLIHLATLLTRMYTTA